MPPHTAPRSEPLHFLDRESPEHRNLNGLLIGLWDGPLLTRQAPGTLTRWRRGLGRTHEECPFLSMEVAEALRSMKAPSPQMQEAVFQTLALYAAHQQSVSTAMHDGDRERYPRGNSLGHALNVLCIRRAPNMADPWRHDDNKGVVRLLEAAVTSHSVPELVGHVRHVVSLLRRESIPLDYARLARDIHDWSKSWRGKTANQWAMDFHSPVAARNTAPENTEEEH
jgi:CRISPR system Cascade subunit CasB